MPDGRWGRKVGRERWGPPRSIWANKQEGRPTKKRVSPLEFFIQLSNASGAAGLLRKCSLGDTLIIVY